MLWARVFYSDTIEGDDSGRDLAVSRDENFIFINAMNEWAEGNHLEPCIKYGTAYLEATKNALKSDN